MTSLRTSVSLGLLVIALLLAAALVGRQQGGSSTPILTSSGSKRAEAAATDGQRAEATDTSEGTDTTRPPATGLDPGLQAAFDRAQLAAADAGHTLVINSGYRTPERQQELLDEEVAERGSYEAAAPWVFTPERSMHVQGLAIDVGDGPAADWLAANGASYGICHTLSWEWWHFEWRARWQDSGTCPPEAQDPSEAPPI